MDPCFPCWRKLACCLAASLAVGSAAHAAELVVIVEQVKAGVGDVRVALFNDPKSFPKQRFQGQRAAAAEGTVTLSFKDLPAGRYAASAFQDLNVNEKLDTNAFGAPREPYGFSRGARGRFGPPDFDDASIEVGAEGRTIRISLE